MIRSRGMKRPWDMGMKRPWDMGLIRAGGERLGQGCGREVVK